MPSVPIITLLLFPVLCAAAFGIVRRVMRGDLEREKKWAAYEHRNNRLKR